MFKRRKIRNSLCFENGDPVTAFATDCNIFRNNFDYLSRCIGEHLKHTWSAQLGFHSDERAEKNATFADSRVRIMFRLVPWETLFNAKPKSVEVNSLFSTRSRLRDLFHAFWSNKMKSVVTVLLLISLGSSAARETKGFRKSGVISCLFE